MSASSSSRKEFVAEAGDLLEEAASHLLEVQDSLSGGEPSPDAINALFRAMHTLKGMSGLFGFQGLADINHSLESLLDMARMGKASMDDAMAAFLFRIMDAERAMLSIISKTGAEGTEEVAACLSDIESFIGSMSEGGAKDDGPDLSPFEDILGVLSEYEEHRLKTNIKAGKAVYAVKKVFPLETFDTELKSLSEKIKTVAEIISTMPTPDGMDAGSIGFNVLAASSASRADFEKAAGCEASERVPLAAAQPHAARAASKGPQHEADALHKAVSSTLRVDIAKIDLILNSVGEIAKTKNALRRIWSNIVEVSGHTPLTIDLYRVAQSMDRKIQELQNLVLAVRMVPVGQIFARLNQIIRRYSKRAGKQINISMFGEDTEIDKAIAEEIADPLMHIVRNAIDHGIEQSDVRERAGKPGHGNVVIKAYQKGNSVVIEVRDDGGGIDTDRIRAKAVAKGLIEEGMALDRREAYEFMFMPGFSTADSVSEISGRGVGLDVVRAKLAELGGQVDIQSEMGKGTVFSITLPITLALVKALTVRAGEAIVCAPLSAMSETFIINTSRIQDIEDRKVYNFRGAALPLFPLASVLDLPGHAGVTGVDGSAQVLVVGSGERKIGLLVDEMLAQEEIIIKPLGNYFDGLRGFAGAAEIGKYKVVLVLDVEQIIDDALEVRRPAASIS